jgi:hypothetical protein
MIKFETKFTAGRHVPNGWCFGTGSFFSTACHREEAKLLVAELEAALAAAKEMVAEQEAVAAEVAAEAAEFNEWAGSTVV